MCWDQALDLVLQAKGLDRRVTANVLLVALASRNWPHGSCWPWSRAS